MRIFISLPAQTLELFDDAGTLLCRYRVSTARRGAGEVSGSFRTPRGRHLIRARIGGGCPDNIVFVRRRPTGEQWTPELAAQQPQRDWILTRILWLSGCQPGFNRLGEVDTMRRYIYLHGCTDTADMGIPGSIGCVRMRNRDIIELFDRVPVYTPVNIGEYSVAGEDWLSPGGTALRLVRQAVFVEEQGIDAALEWDALDAGAQHALARETTGAAVGTGRLLADGRIGRLSVLPAWRGKGVGVALLCHLLERAGQAGLPQVYLHARSAAAGFYRRLGFVADGAPFLETGTSHVRMVRRLQGVQAP